MHWIASKEPCSTHGGVQFVGDIPSVQKLSSGHGEQARSENSVQGVDEKNPGSQAVEHDSHSLFPVAEQFLDSNKPFSHTSRHAYASTLLGQNLPSSHGVHWRLVVAVQREVSYSPISHGVEQVTAAALSPRQNDPLGHWEQITSSVCVHGDETYFPTEHDGGEHSSTLIPSGQNNPSWHGTHTRSVAAVQSTVWYVPGEHGGKQVVRFESRQKEFSKHGEQARSLVMLQALISYSPTSQ